MKTGHWSQQKEQGGGFWQFRLVLFLFRVLGPVLTRLIALPVALIIYLKSPAMRASSREYFDRLRPKRLSQVRHFCSFAVALVDKMAAWAGKINRQSVDIAGGDFESLVDDLRNRKGALAICSHLGNVEMLRALGSTGNGEIDNLMIWSIVEFGGTSKFNKILETLNRDSMNRILPVSGIGPHSMISMKDFAGEGGLIVIAGDRTSRENQDRTISRTFLGSTAPFPYGTFLLADLLEIPVYFIFAMREHDIRPQSRYRVYCRQSGTETGGGKKGREIRLNSMAGEYSSMLEELCRQYPYQWFNFFSFWNLEKG